MIHPRSGTPGNEPSTQPPSQLGGSLLHVSSHQSAVTVVPSVQHGSAHTSQGTYAEHPDSETWYGGQVELPCTSTVPSGARTWPKDEIVLYGVLSKAAILPMQELSHHIGGGKGGGGDGSGGSGDGGGGGDGSAEGGTSGGGGDG